MTDDTADVAMEKIALFEAARADLLAALSGVEETIRRNNEAKDAILSSLSDENFNLAPKRQPRKQTKAAKEQEVEDVAQHVPGPETQEQLAELVDNAEDLDEAIQDWEPGSVENGDSDTGSSLDFEFDEIKF